MKNYTYLLLSLLSLSFAENDTISFCAKHDCPQEINRLCRRVNSTVECLEGINNGDITIGLAAPNEVFLASGFYSNLKIAAQLVPSREVTSNWQQEIVIVVNQPVTSFHELRNFKYFHIDLEKLKLQRYIPNIFEELIIEDFKTDACRSTPTLAEQNICTLNGFFAPSCRSDSWVDYEEQKFAFSKDYPKLTQLCYNKASFEVLNDHNGVVVATTLESIKILNQNFYYLWSNGMTSTEPYSWHRQSWPMILTSEENFSEARYKLNVWFANCKGFTEDSINIERRIFPYNREEVEPNCKNSFGTLLLSTNPIVVIKDEAENVPSWESKENAAPLRWCTISKEETNKCKRIQLISGNLAYPIQCVERQDKLACFKAIEEQDADIVGDKNPIALVNLKPIATIEYFNKEIVASNYQFIMRRRDPNIANAKVLLASLNKLFVDGFLGTPNLLFESTSQFKLTIEAEVTTATTIATKKTSSGPNLLVPMILILLWITIGLVAFVSRKFICKKKQADEENDTEQKLV